MDNINEKTVSFVQQPKESTGNNDDEEIITQLTLAGLKVLMVRKRDQIIYKLPDNMQVTSIGEEQRQQLMKEIQTLHQATMAAASAAQQQQLQQQSEIKPIAPKADALSSLDTPPQPTAAEADAMKETARKLREELEQQQQQQMLLQQQQQQGIMRTTSYDYPNSPQDNANKTTRKYNKTGKYSKKKQQQILQQHLQQQQNPQSQQQQQMTQQQLLALQQSLQPAGGYVNPSSHTSASNTPIGNSPFAYPPSQPMQLSNHSSPVPSATPPLQSTAIQSPQPQSTPSSPAQPVTSPPVAQKPPPSIVQKPSQTQPPADSILSKRLPEEELQHREIKKRFIESLLDDHKLVTTPDYKTPFKSLKDAMTRLMPYHIYQYPKHDLDANKIPLERQDHTMIEIFKCQTELFDKYSAIVKKINQNGQMTLKIFSHREVVASQRQKLTEEQSRVAAEQAAQHQEMLRIQAEKARLSAEEEARQQQQQLLQQQQQVLADQFHLQPSSIQPMQSISPQQQQQQQQVIQALQPQQILQPQQMMQPQQQQQAMNYVNGLAQANALLQNPQFLNHYNQLSPELQQRLLRNREQLVALIEKQQFNHVNNSNNNNNS